MGFVIAECRVAAGRVDGGEDEAEAGEQAGRAVGVGSDSVTCGWKQGGSTVSASSDTGGSWCGRKGAVCVCVCVCVGAGVHGMSSVTNQVYQVITSCQDCEITIVMAHSHTTTGRQTGTGRGAYVYRGAYGSIWWG